MCKAEFKAIVDMLIAMLGIGIMGVSFTLTPYTIPLNPILLIGGLGLIIIGLYRLSSETK